MAQLVKTFQNEALNTARITAQTSGESDTFSWRLSDGTEVLRAESVAHVAEPSGALRIRNINPDMSITEFVKEVLL